MINDLKNIALRLPTPARRLVYLGYYLVNYKDWIFIKNGLNNAQKVVGRNRASLILDALYCCLHYNTSLADYFNFGFFQLPASVRCEYAGAGTVFEFQSAMNDFPSRDLFQSKSKWCERFAEFMGREWLSLAQVKFGEFEAWIKRHPVFFAKPDRGAQGVGIERVNTCDFACSRDLYKFLQTKKLSLLEEPIKQHELMDRLSQAAINTIRVVTVLCQDRVDVICTVLRISTIKPVDNFTAGGIAALIDEKTGVVQGAAMSKDGRFTYEYHPVTGQSIIGFKIPYWTKVLETVRRAALMVPDVRTVGWDVAISETGPVLIEGNDNWGYTLWQLPCGHGLKHVLDRYKDDCQPRTYH